MKHYFIYRRDNDSEKLMKTPMAQRKTISCTDIGFSFRSCNHSPIYKIIGMKAIRKKARCIQMTANTVECFVKRCKGIFCFRKVLIYTVINSVLMYGDKAGNSISTVHRYISHITQNFVRVFCSGFFYLTGDDNLIQNTILSIII